MNTIYNYVESIFINLPRTEEIERLKEDMLINMEEKYDDLKGQGFSENEAIGTVLSEFGNIDEIIEEYNLSLENENEFEDPNELNMSREDVEDYLHHRQQFSFAMAIGVFLCIIAVPIMFVFQIMLRYFTGTDRSFLIGVAAMLFVIAIGVGLFVVFGMKESHYPFDKKILKLDTLTYSRLSEDYKQFKPRFGYAIATGVVLCIVGVIALILSLLLLNNEAMWGVIFLLSFIATAVFLFVYFGIQNDTYQKLLTIGSHTRAHIKSNKLTESVSAVIFPLATLFYLYQGFFYNNWGTAWVVFPIVGISFGIFAAIVEALATMKYKE